MMTPDYRAAPKHVRDDYAALMDEALADWAATDEAIRGLGRKRGTVAARVLVSTGRHPSGLQEGYRQDVQHNLVALEAQADALRRAFIGRARSREDRERRLLAAEGQRQASARPRGSR